MSQEIFELLAVYSHCLKRQLPFALYRLPAQKSIQLVIQNTSKTNHQVQRCGFLFAPFQESKTAKTIFIAGDIVGIKAALAAIHLPPKTKPQEQTKAQLWEAKAMSKAEFEQYISCIKEEIAKGKLQKSVAARLVRKKVAHNFHPVRFFKKLCRQYPDAFVSLVFTPEYGIWIGATPEVLLQVSGQKMCTYSLAGTQANKHKRQVSWGKKEQAEQQIVTEYILQCLTAAKLKEVEAAPTETIAAGNLLHLRTVLSARLKRFSQWQEIAQRLHPTPAVAGMPKRSALSLIKKFEKDHRRFYSGYCGPVNTQAKEVQLFVNLRCVQQSGAYLFFHSGCGITQNSIAAKEWQETRLKMQTLQSVFSKK